ISGFVVISLFTTKIDTYLMPFLIPCCLLITLFFFEEKQWSFREVFIVFTLFLINLFWYLTPAVRNEIKEYVMSGTGMIVAGIGFIVLAAGVFFISRYVYNKVSFRKVYLYLVIIFFVYAN